MPNRPVIIGAGHNGLVAAFYLARAGLRPLVLERGETVGGAASSREFYPGFRSSALAHACGPLRPSIAADMQLLQHGLQLVRPETACVAWAPDGRALRLDRDPWKAAASVGRFSERDAARYPEFLATIGRLARVVAALADEIPPSLEDPSPADMWRLLSLARRFRALGRADGNRLLRWGPMPVADVVDEWFESDPLRAILAARALVGARLGPRSAGTMALLLLEAARDPDEPLTPCFVRGGMGSLGAVLAVAARQAGAEIRTGARVSRIDVAEDGVRGVVLEGGETIPASTVVSNADPRQTLLGLVDPMWLDPTLLWRIGNYRSQGTLAKLNIALDALPQFRGVDAPGPGVPNLDGRLVIAPDLDTMERAFDASKYGRPSERPWLEVVVPTILDPELAPAGKHVMSVYAQYAPYALRPAGAGAPTSAGAWAAARPAFVGAVLDTLATAAPDVAGKVLHVELLTPADLERDHGLTGGHIHHGEMSLDQLFVMRPLLGWERHRMPIRGLYLCGAGTHPGGGLTGANGAHAARVIVEDMKR